MKKNGFTLVELVTVIILLGIISAITLPRFFDNQTFTSFFDQSEFESALNWTRNRAVTTQCAHEFRIDSTGWFVVRDDDRDGDSADSDCASISNAGNTCDAVSEEFLSFAYSGPGDIVLDSSNNALSGAEITAPNLQRLIFSPEGRLYLLTTAPTNLARGCTALPANPIANGSTISLNGGVSLTIDGETAYVAVQ